MIKVKGLPCTEAATALGLHHIKGEDLIRATRSDISSNKKTLLIIQPLDETRLPYHSYPNTSSDSIYNSSQSLLLVSKKLI